MTELLMIVIGFFYCLKRANFLILNWRTFRLDKKCIGGLGPSMYVFFVNVGGYDTAVYETMGIACAYHGWLETV
jgi:hypothetical protein